MKKEFEFRPFDRVTVNLHEENLRAVLSDGCGKLLSGAYADSYGLNNFTCDVERIKPGHYDAEGNWLPQPGEPCHIILANGSPKNMVVVSAEECRITAIGENDTERTIYIETSLGFVDGAWYFDMSESDAIPQSAMLHPGRIKPAEQ